MKTLSLPALLLGALLPLASCAALGLGDDEPEAEWVSRELTAPSENVIWQVALRALGKLDFPLGAGLQPDELVAVSGWRNTLMPFKDKGYRLRATVTIEPLNDDDAPAPEDRRRFRVRVRVERQVNRALVNPLDLRYAEWEAEPDDPHEAAILLQHIRSYVDTELPVGPRP